MSIIEIVLYFIGMIAAGIDPATAQIAAGLASK